MKREDAEHLMDLLKTLAPPFKNVKLIMEEEFLRDVRAGAKEHGGNLCVWSPIDSMEFFKRYEELLPQYYR
jgi:hypothetical protein